MDPDNNKETEAEKPAASPFSPSGEQKPSQFTPPRGSGFTAPVINHKKSHKALWVTIALLLVLTGTGLLGFLWFSEKDRADKLDQQVESLVAQKQSSGEKEEKPAAAQSKYQADVGKFTLTLGDKYYIVVEHDGGFEGGPVTQLLVASKNDKGEQTLTAPSHESVSITAVPLNGEAFEDRVEAALSDTDESSKSTLPAVKVDGVEAQAYRITGLFNDKKLFFTKNDVFYTITAGNAENEQSTSQAVLDDVIKGFKFN